MAAKIDREVQQKLQNALERAKQLLSQNRDKLDGLCDLLMERETIDRKTFMAFMNGEEMVKPEEIQVDEKKETEEVL